MAAGMTDRLWSLEDVIAKIDAVPPKPGKLGPIKNDCKRNVSATLFRLLRLNEAMFI